MAQVQIYFFVLSLVCLELVYKESEVNRFAIFK